MTHDSLWWYHSGNRAIRVGDWKWVAAGEAAPELYDLKSDRSECRNLAADYPDKLGELQQAWTRLMEEFQALAKQDAPLAQEPQKNLKTPGN